MSESGRFSINEDPGRSSPMTSVHHHVRDVVSATQRYAPGCLWPCCTVHVFVCFLEDLSRVAAEQYKAESCRKTANFAGLGKFLEKIGTSLRWLKRTAAADGPSVDVQAAPDGHSTGDGSETVPSSECLANR